MNKQSKLAISSVLLLLVISIAVTLQMPPSDTQGSPCKLSQQPCLLSVANGGVSIVLENASIQLEEETYVSFTTDNFQVDAAWIEGINMYMGKIPVLPDGDGRWVFFLGMCSEPKMDWRLFIKGTDAHGQTHTLSATFSTQR